MKMYFRTGLSLFIMATLLFSCKENGASNYENASAEMTEAVDTAMAVTSSSAAKVNPKEKRKFIRTADIKFKVKNVAKSTYAIEEATSKFGGFVTYTNLQSTILEQDQTKVSQDSILITTQYNVTNDITLRVPNTKLDTVIKTIAKQIDFLDYRVIKADDVSTQILSKELEQKRSEKSERRIEKAIDTKGSKLTSIIDAENKLDAKKAENDSKTIEKLSLNDQVNFSTVTLAIYQNKMIQQEMQVHQKSANAYRPHLGLQIWESLKTGWHILETIIAFVVQLWGVFAIVAAFYY
jgi:Domain of unknown function (DUF4349)